LIGGIFLVAVLRRSSVSSGYGVILVTGSGVGSGTGVGVGVGSGVFSGVGSGAGSVVGTGVAVDVSEGVDVGEGVGVSTGGFVSEYLLNNAKATATISMVSTTAVIVRAVSPLFLFDLPLIGFLLRNE